MIRFPCAHCQKTLKAPPDRIGAKATCPKCGKRTRVPASSTVHGHEDKESRLSEKVQESIVSTIPPMGPRVKAAFAGLGLLALLSLGGLLAGLGAIAGIVLGLTVIGLLVSVIGHATSCPACRLWWAKEQTKTDLFDRVIFYKNDKGEVVGSEHAEDQPLTGEGAPWVRSTYKTTFQCKHCNHHWHRTYSDTYKHIESKPRKPANPREEID